MFIPTDSFTIPGKVKANKETVPIHLVNLYYDGKVNELNVNFNTDIRRSDCNVNSGIEENSQNYDDRMLSIESCSRNSLFASKLVLSHPLWKGKFSLGSEYTRTSQKNTFQNSEDFPTSSKNEVKESNIAAFSEYRLKFGSLNINAGIRYEHVDSKYFDNGVKVNEQSKTVKLSVWETSGPFKLYDENEKAFVFTTRRQPDIH
jgi:outer membrane receptor protein involved in Fe transport